jgi:hypothetical protein
VFIGTAILSASFWAEQTRWATFGPIKPNLTRYNSLIKRCLFFNGPNMARFALEIPAIPGDWRNAARAASGK